MAVIAVSFTSSASDVYNFVFDKFFDTTIPRSYVESNTFSFSVSGTAILNGPAYRQKRIWAINSLLTNEQAEDFDEMYIAWDQDRSEGLNVALGLADTTFGPQINANVIFSTPPTYQKFDPRHMLVAFGVTEI
jgi:hypothetical protein